MYKKVEASFWTAEEVDLFQDLRHQDQSLKWNECHFVTHVLTFFTATDRIIIQNLAGQISTEVGSVDSKLIDGTVMIRGVA
ncbi:hypothetical protein M5K25_011687 [Dendrobium thyrsiflorum]|uniref:Uncharacterized protein n=1 Tax=Dendrobium thyrsiflorum TaxID=117978 RepID=A0ABD0V3U8_DENTH